jgi:dienelactone hydrolase
MSTVILDNKTLKDLQPATGLWELYAPAKAPYRFRARSVSEARQWQAETRQALGETLGFQSLPLVPLAPEKIEQVDKGDYVREKILLRTSQYSLMPVYVLVPKQGGKPFPVVVAFHGHGYGVKDIVGLWEDGEERNTPDGYHKDFAVALCRRGIAVAAPEISCFGERQTDFSYVNTTIGQPVPDTCTHTAMLAFHLGGSVAGLRVRDGRRLIDYLETREDVDVDRLGAMGISGGGMHTFFSTCMDERIKACVVSGYYSTFRDSILAMLHCACNFVPGMSKFGEMYDLVGLIAPRPLLIEAGNHDPIFPLAAVKRSVKEARAVYEVFRAREQLETDYFEGRHQISGKRAYDFLMEKLQTVSQQRC